MALSGNEPPKGLRERKKERTRARLIDAAMELCLEQGYEQTTVEQIAAAADVAPRTFSRYFATKDAVFLTLIEDFAEQLVVELAAVPDEVGPLEALRAATVATLARVADSTLDGLTDERIVLMLRIVNASNSLRQGAFEFRHAASDQIMAQRLGLEVGDRRLLLVSSTFSAVTGAAWGDLLADTDGVRLGARVMIDRLNESFAHLMWLTADVRGPVEELAYEAVNG